ncbi:MAG TPA: DinB family protein [Dehalococcoidia bacterium]
MTAVRSTQDELMRLVANLDDVRAGQKPATGEWSVRDLIRHGIDAEERVTHQIEFLLQGREPKPYNTPPGVVMALEDNGEPFAEFVRRLGTANAAFQRLLVEFDVDAGPSSMHDDLGRFTAGQWVAFEAWHDGDHLTHAREILASTGDMHG